MWRARLYYAVVSLRIRLSRVGAKKQASYRIVVADSAAPRDGKAIAILGHYNPLTDPYTLKVDEERAVNWLQKGAQPSDTARGLLNKAGVIEAFEKVRKGAPQRRRVTADEAKARREARAKRTEPARLVRPARSEGEEGAAAKPAAATRRAAAKPASRAKAGAKTATKSRATAAKASASKTAAKSSGGAASSRRATAAKKADDK